MRQNEAKIGLGSSDLDSEFGFLCTKYFCQPKGTLLGSFELPKLLLVLFLCLLSCAMENALTTLELWLELRSPIIGEDTFTRPRVLFFPPPPYPMTPAF